MIFCRDIAEHIRHRIKAAFDTEQGFIGDSKYCDKQYNSMKNIVDNYHASLYKRTKPFTSTGLTAEECKLILSNESLATLESEFKSNIKSMYWRREKK